MANNNRNDKDVIYDSERDRHVTHTADSATNRTGAAGDRVKETTTRETRHVAHEEPKKKSPWPWLIPLLLLLLAIPFLLNLCNNDKDDKKKRTKQKKQRLKMQQQKKQQQKKQQQKLQRLKKQTLVVLT